MLQRKKIDITTIAVCSRQQGQKGNTGNNLVMMDGRRGHERGNVEPLRLMRRGFNAGKMKGIIVLYNIK